MKRRINIKNCLRRQIHITIMGSALVAMMNYIYRKYPLVKMPICGQPGQTFKKTFRLNAVFGK